MATLYTKKALIERIFKHLNDGFPGQDWTITEAEMLGYIDQAIPGVMKGQIFDNAKTTGLLEVPDAYLLNYELPITVQNANTKEWTVTLPQPPLELPTGYDITNVYIADPVNGRSQNAWPIKTKRAAYRGYLPRPSGFSYRLEGYSMFLKAGDGGSLLNYNLNVQMPVSRTSDVNAPMNMPDGAIEPLFVKTVSLILQRYQIPQDIIRDGLPAGNKSS